MEKNPPYLPPSASPWSKTEAAKFFHGAITDRVLACAVSVHKELGPGFLEAIYEEAFAFSEAKTRIRRVMGAPEKTTEKGREGGR